MTLIIEDWHNKVVVDKSSPWGTRVLDEYELKHSTEYPRGGGWTSREKWRKTAKKRRGFMGFDASGAAKIDQGRSYGIHSYLRVYLAE